MALVSRTGEIDSLSTNPKRRSTGALQSGSANLERGSSGHVLECAAAVPFFIRWFLSASAAHREPETVQILSGVDRTPDGRREAVRIVRSQRKFSTITQRDRHSV